MKKLNLTEWAAVAEVIGTIGVIVSLIFVAHSINTSTDEARASQTHVIFDTSRQIDLTVAADPEWSRIVVQGRSRQEPLSEVEQYRYDAYLVAVIDLWDQMLERYDDGLMDDQEVGYWELYFADWAQRHLTESAWQRIKWNYTGGDIGSKIEAAISDASSQ